LTNSATQNGITYLSWIAPIGKGFTLISNIIRTGAKLITKQAVKEGMNVFKHSYKYADRITKRAIQDPVSHNFPYSFDDVILSAKPIFKNNGYKIFQKQGTMNNKNGIFEIGLTKDGIIDHRFFRPFK
jgi:hypothetical protein